MKNKAKYLIKGETAPLKTLTRHELEQDWYNLHLQLQKTQQKIEDFEKQFVVDTKEFKRLEQQNVNDLSYIEYLQEKVLKLEQENTELNNKISNLEYSLEYLINNTKENKQ